MGQNVLGVKDLNIELKKDTSEDKITLVQNVSFELQRDETLAVVGESGSGKTLTMSAIMRLMPINGSFEVSGKISIEGKDVSRVSSKAMDRVRKKDISMIFQDPLSALNPIMRIGKQVAECLEEYPRKERKARVIALLEEVQIKNAPKVYRNYPHQLSGGMRQRVCIAMALAKDPGILIADEPTTALDASVQKNVLDLLLRIKKEKQLSIVIVTHDMGVVRYLADRVIVMHEGKIVESGTKDDVFNSPQHPYTAKLLSAVELGGGQR